MPRSTSVAGAGVAVVIALVALFLGRSSPALPSTGTTLSPTWQRLLRKATPLQRHAIPWQQFGNASAVAVGARPVLLRHSPASEWPLMQWTPRRVQEALGDGRVSDVLLSHDVLGRVVYHDTSKPMRHLVDTLTSRSNLDSVAASRFFAMLGNRTQGHPLAYLVGTLANGNLPPSLLQHTDGGQFHVDGGGETYSQMWLGSEGFVSVMHYDAAHNFFVQVSGRKRFLFVHPKYGPQLHLHPWLHPGESHSQADLGTEPLKLDVDGVEAEWVEVGPGDVLYIPPYYFHQVESLPSPSPSPSSLPAALSVSFITPSAVQSAMTAVEGMVFPGLDNAWGRPDRRKFVGHLLSRLSRALHMDDVFLRLLQSRYVRLVEVDERVERSGGKCQPPALPQSTQRSLTQAIARAASLWLAVEEVHTRELLFWNYVESLCNWVTMGDAEKVPRLLLHYANHC